jgi:hypothetical protein
LTATEYPLSSVGIGALRLGRFADARLTVDRAPNRVLKRWSVEIRGSEIRGSDLAKLIGGISPAPGSIPKTVQHPTIVNASPLRECSGPPPFLASSREQRSVTSRRNAAATGWKAVTASPFHTRQFAEQWATEKRCALEADGWRDPKA